MSLFRRFFEAWFFVWLGLALVEGAVVLWAVLTA